MAGLFVLLVVRLGLIVIPVLVVAALVLAAAWVDELAHRIPNQLVLAGMVSVAVGIPIVAALHDSTVSTIGMRVAVGVVLGGAPVLFLIWLLDPEMIGGGDWKLLATSSAALGLLLPIVAVVATLVACVFQFARFAFLRQRMIPFGPAIATGLLVALATVPTISRLTGGEFQ